MHVLHERAAGEQIDPRLPEFPGTRQMSRARQWADGKNRVYDFDRDIPAI